MHDCVCACICVSDCAVNIIGLDVVKGGCVKSRRCPSVCKLLPPGIGGSVETASVGG